MARAASTRELKVEILPKQMAMVVSPIINFHFLLKEGQMFVLAKLSEWKIDILSESEYNEKIADERAEEKGRRRCKVQPK